MYNNSSYHDFNRRPCLHYNQLLQLCTARTVFSIYIGHCMVTVRLYKMQEVCHRLTNEKQRKSDIRLTDQ